MVQLSMEELERMSSKDLYDHLDTKNVYYLKNDLKSLFERRKMGGYVSQSATKDEVRNELLYGLSVEIINAVISPGTDKRYIDMDLIQGRSTAYKIDFIEKYGKYLPVYQLERLLRCDFGKEKSHKAYLIDDYLSCLSTQKNV